MSQSCELEEYSSRDHLLVVWHRQTRGTDWPGCHYRDTFIRYTVWACWAQERMSLLWWCLVSGLLLTGPDWLCECGLTGPQAALTTRRTLSGCWAGWAQPDIDITAISPPMESHGPVNVVAVLMKVVTVVVVVVVLEMLVVVTALSVAVACCPPYILCYPLPCPGRELELLLLLWPWNWADSDSTLCVSAGNILHPQQERGEGSNLFQQFFDCSQNFPCAGFDLSSQYSIDLTDSTNLCWSIEVMLQVLQSSIFDNAASL